MEVVEGHLTFFRAELNAFFLAVEDNLVDVPLGVRKFPGDGEGAGYVCDVGGILLLMS